jgi:hypothetical protein
MTVGGTEAADAFELDNTTVVPPDGAALNKVTVPVRLVPPVTVPTETPIAESSGTRVLPVPFTSRTGEGAVTEPYVEDNTTGVLSATLPIVMGTETDTEPAGIVTIAGALTAPEFELATDTVAPPEGAAAVRIACAVTFAPALTSRWFR